MHDVYILLHITYTHTDICIPYTPTHLLTHIHIMHMHIHARTLSCRHAKIELHASFVDKNPYKKDPLKKQQMQGITGRAPSD